MELRVKRAPRIEAEITVPGDKSISHRAAIIAALSNGVCTLRGFLPSDDCMHTVNALRALGIQIEQPEPDVLTVHGKKRVLTPPKHELDCGGSGTTMRLLSGLLAGQTFETRLVGNPSLTRRPMDRIIEPLRRFGATVYARDDNYLPLKVKGGVLTPLEFTMPVASAQVKSSILLAGLHARGTTRVHEPVPSRNHTEIALAEFGASIRTSPQTIEIEGGHSLYGKKFWVPGDLSSAAFFIAAVLAVPNSHLRLTAVGLNPTRAGFIRLLEEMHANITVVESSAAGGEPVGDIVAESSEIAGMDIGGSWIPNVIDEIQVLAVLGTRMQKGIRIRDAAELRAKESDRIHALAINLRALGADVEEYSDGVFVQGRQTLRGGVVDSFGDHRIAMAFAVAGLFAQAPVIIKDPGCVAISFPGFFELLRQMSSDNCSGGL